MPINLRNLGSITTDKGEETDPILNAFHPLWG
jgi:hypothetical protein